MSCKHQLKSTWLVPQDATAQLQVDWCPDCGAVREQLVNYVIGDPPLDGAEFLEPKGPPSKWTAPVAPEIAELTCAKSPNGKHAWLDSGETLRCVTYQCEHCNRRGSGSPGVPDKPFVPGRLPLESEETIETRHKLREWGCEPALKDLVRRARVIVSSGACSPFEVLQVLASFDLTESAGE